MTREELDTYINEIALDCEEEGYPSRGSNYELRVAEMEKWLFGEDETPDGEWQPAGISNDDPAVPEAE